MVTCESVISESIFLLHRGRVDYRRVLELLRRGLVQLDFKLAEQVEFVASKMSDYADLPMSLADACLVRMAEPQPKAEIITLDRRFKQYRTRGRRVLKVRLPPERKP